MSCNTRAILLWINLILSPIFSSHNLLISLNRLPLLHYSYQIHKQLYVVLILQNYDSQLTHTAYPIFRNIIGTKLSVVWMHHFQSHQPKIVSFCFCFTCILSLICLALQYLIVLQTLNLSLISIIRKKIYTNFVTFYPLHIETLKVLVC